MNSLSKALGQPTNAAAWEKIISSDPNEIKRRLDRSAGPTGEGEEPVSPISPTRDVKGKDKQEIKSFEADTERKMTLDEAAPFWPEYRGDTDYRKYKNFVWDVFEKPEGSIVSNYINLYVLVLILIGAIIMMVESLPDIHQQYDDIFIVFEYFFSIQFSIELFSRLLSCPDCGEFWMTGMNYIDVVSILPFWLEIILGSMGINLQSLRILRLGRAFRMVKLGRYSSGIRLIQNSLFASLDALQLFAMIFTVMVIVLASAAYYTERGVYKESADLVNNEANSEVGYYRESPIEEQEELSPFQSIPHAFWWCIVTLVTVGYGDYTTITAAGQVVGIITQLSGVIVLALPLSIIGANFHEEREKINREIEDDSWDDDIAQGALETAQDSVDAGDRVLDSLNLVSVGLAECICTAVDMLHTVHGDDTADTIVASPLASQEGNVENVPEVPIDVQEEAASEFVGVPQQPSSPPPPDTLVKIHSDTLELLQSKIENLCGLMDEMRADL